MSVWCAGGVLECSREPYYSLLSVALLCVPLCLCVCLSPSNSTLPPPPSSSLLFSSVSGDLGCFSLTEQFAGVHSGLVVHTTATYDPTSACFTIHSPQQGARKNWISQGFVADKT